MFCDGEDEKTQNPTVYMITDFKVQPPTTFLLWAAFSCYIYLFTYIGSAIVCLFPATDVTSTISSTLASASTVKDKESQIIVAWQSLIGFRSLIGNCFYCEDDTMWNRPKRFIMRFNPSRSVFSPSNICSFSISGRCKFRNSVCHGVDYSPQSQCGVR